MTDSVIIRRYHPARGGDMARTVPVRELLRDTEEGRRLDGTLVKFSSFYGVKSDRGLPSAATAFRRRRKPMPTWEEAKG